MLIHMLGNAEMWKLAGGNKFAVMALMPTLEECSFERVDVFDIIYHPYNTNEQLVDIPGTLGWEIRDIIIS
jgi:hypothetical protein